MINRKKIMTWLEICGKNMDYPGSCPYGDGSEACEDSFCREALMTDALALLKEQEAELLQLKESSAKKPVLREKGGFWEFVCPTCGSLDEEVAYEWNYCPYCGQELEWE